MKAIVMAAGKGTRLNEKGNPMPKVLRVAGERTLLAHVLDDTLGFMDNDDITVVVGYLADQVKAAFPQCHFALQGTDGYGTGYAVKCGIKNGNLEDYQGDIGVFNGDAPLIKRETVTNMFDVQKKTGAKCTLLVCDTKAKLPYGRVLRDKDGKVIEIKEEKDCNEEEKKITELNCGVYIFDAEALRESLSKLNNNNSQGEYYITDVPKILLDAGYRVETYTTYDETEVLGVNTFEDLDRVAQIVKERNSK